MKIFKNILAENRTKKSQAKSHFCSGERLRPQQKRGFIRESQTENHYQTMTLRLIIHEIEDFIGTYMNEVYTNSEILHHVKGFALQL